MSSSYRLLVVEDSADDAELLLDSLRDAPFKVTSTRVETEAEYDAALAEELPDVVLCDYHLPRFSADRALQYLHERQLDIPFIVVSHHIGEDAAVAAMHNGASDYLLKSQLGRLPMAIEAAIDRRISHRQKAMAEQALRASEAMKRGILDSLNTRIAVLDGHGVIIAVNKAWQDVGDPRAMLYETPATVGTNYLALLQDETGYARGLIKRELKVLRAVINREAASGSTGYKLAAPGGTRWFLARAVPLEGSADGAVLSHEDVTDQMLAQQALGEANERLQAMSKRILGIQEEERRSVSRELHDDIGQSLAALKIGLHRLASRANGEHKELITDCLDIANTTLDKLRNLSHRLRPPQLDQLGLEDALEWLVERQCSTTGLDIACEIAGLGERLPAELEVVCYRVAQEALNNATRHAKAKRIRIRVELTDNVLNLVIRDEGVGFDMDAARKKALKTGSQGLISMVERAQLAGGRLKIRTAPGAGTTVQVTFALKNFAHPIADGSGDQNAAAAP